MDRPILTGRVPGRPVSWKRAQSAGKRRYTDPAMDAHANKIAARVLVAARQARVRQFPECIHLTVWALWPRPGTIPVGHMLHGTDPSKRHPRPPVPDSDNVGKLVMDAIGRIRPKLWGDDAQVTRLEVLKRWGADDEEACTIIEVREDE